MHTCMQNNVRQAGTATWPTWRSSSIWEGWDAILRSDLHGKQLHELGGRARVSGGRRAAHGLAGAGRDGLPLASAHAWPL